MFIRIKNINLSGGRKRAYAYLVKNYWDPEKKQSRQKVIHYLGKVEGMTQIYAKEIFDKDGGMCRNCGSWDDLTIDHIIPLTKGGTNDVDNLQTLCRKCNQKKGTKSNFNKKEFYW
jgi:5-methylcytosine-specific restriction endonuclease McrA